MKIKAKNLELKIRTNHSIYKIDDSNRRLTDAAKLDYILSKEKYCKENNIDKVQVMAVVAIRHYLIKEIISNRLARTPDNSKYSNFKLNRYGKYEVNCRLLKLAEALYLINNESRSSKYINELRKRDLLNLSYQNYETLKNYIYNANFGRNGIQGKLVEELITLLNCSK